MAEIAGQLTIENRKAIRREAKDLFAEFTIRVVAALLDVVILIGVVAVARDHFLPRIFAEFLEYQVTLPLLLVVYFLAFWVSPMRSTPTQFLLGMRVLNQSGGTLNPRNALLRAIALVAIFTSAVAAISVPDTYAVKLFVLFPLALLCLMIGTPNRQSAHDLLAHSIVVNRRATKSRAQRLRMMEALAIVDVDVRRYWRPSITRMFTDSLAIVVPVLLIATVAPIAKDKNLHARAEYALSNTGDMQVAVTEYYLTMSHLPANAEAAGFAARVDYPDGGYRQMEDDGVISIHFTVKPELVTGKFVLTPSINDGEIEWQCRQVGDIQPNLTPWRCRD